MNELEPWQVAEMDQVLARFDEVRGVLLKELEKCDREIAFYDWALSNYWFGFLPDRILRWWWKRRHDEVHGLSQRCS